MRNIDGKNICGLYKPTSGEIFINQTSALDFRHQDYYGFFSVVFQDIDLLPAYNSDFFSGLDREINMF